MMASTGGGGRGTLKKTGNRESEMGNRWRAVVRSHALILHVGRGIFCTANCGRASCLCGFVQGGFSARGMDSGGFPPLRSASESIWIFGMGAEEEIAVTIWGQYKADNFRLIRRICMLRALRSSFFISVVLMSVLAYCALPSWAKDKQANDYPLSGKVLSSSSKGAHSYQVETDSKIYLMLCERVKGFHMGLPECKVDDRPIANGDKVQFRVDGDFAYMPVVNGAEDELRILTTELKVIPPLPPIAAGENGKGSKGDERGMVIGSGMHIAGQKHVAWSTDPSSVQRPFFSAGAPGLAPAPGIAMATPSAPVMAAGPVMAIPVTGGAPVMMMPTGPVGGGPVMGVPVTGGAPVMGMPTGPVMGMPMGGAPMGAAHAGGGGGGPVWVHLLRVRAGEKIYQLECSAKPCEVDKKEIGLGDTLVIRAEKKWAYVSLGANGGGKEQKLRILSETEEDDASDGK